MKGYFSVAVFFVFQAAAVPGILSFPENKVGDDGRSVYGEPHIVGGKEVEPHSHPHQVGIILTPDDMDRGFCGGSLLSDTWVLTAAHCTDFWFIVNAKIVVGAHEIRKNESGVQVLSVAKVHQHPAYDKTKLIHDISLIRLASPARLTEYVQPIQLPSQAEKNWSFWNFGVTLTGWGYRTDRDIAVSPVLEGVETRVVTNFYCTLRYFFQYVYDSNICASGWYSKGTCNGDSGGPMTIKETDGKLTLIGVSSFGVGYGCEKSWPLVFTRVTSYLDWIHNITKIPERH